MLKIVQAPHPVLSTKAKKINKVDATVKKLIKDMAYTLEHTTDPEGVGLAAPQVGEALQLFIIKEDEKAQVKTYINPEILSISKEKLPLEDEIQESGKKKAKKEEKGVKLEGCLSLKDIWGIVNRAAVVKLKYLDENGNQQTEEFTGFLATIIQHECDHLQGILFPKRVLEQNERLYKATTDEKGEMIFEEMAI